MGKYELRSSQEEGDHGVPSLLANEDTAEEEEEDEFKDCSIIVEDKMQDTTGDCTIPYDMEHNNKTLSLIEEECTPLICSGIETPTHTNSRRSSGLWLFGIL